MAASPLSWHGRLGGAQFAAQVVFQTEISGCEVKGPSLMILGAAFAVLLAQAAPSPSPTSSTCPTKEVMRITPNGLVPSAGNPKNSPLPTTGPEVRTATVWVLILVDVNPNGSVRGTRLLHSAGPPRDTRALHEARTSRYQPKMIGCRAVEGIYYFFQPVANF